MLLTFDPALAWDFSFLCCVNGVVHEEVDFIQKLDFCGSVCYLHTLNDVNEMTADNVAYLLLWPAADRLGSRTKGVVFLYCSNSL